ncbi:MAG: ATP synthase F1 subunit delta [Clostridia bacterium]|nr:ATP synthase F1 subunit delta [Clostridia bacterium]
MTGASEYAVALFSLTEELGTSDTAKEDVLSAEAALSANPKYIDLCDTPAISISEKLALISEAFKSLDVSVKNLIMILAEKHSVRLFTAIARKYVSLYNESRGIVEAEAVSAEPLSAGQLDAIKQKLSRMTGKRIQLKNVIDRSIVGGVTLRYMGKQIDGSLKARLSQIEKSLKNTIL